MNPEELLSYERDRQAAARDLAAVRRATVLLARYAAGEWPVKPEVRAVVRDVCGDLRELVDWLEAGLE